VAGGALAPAPPEKFGQAARNSAIASLLRRVSLEVRGYYEKLNRILESRNTNNVALVNKFAPVWRAKLARQAVK
jgi:hypothetical protein